MRILITGAAGFIGSNLAEYHLSKGDEVYALDSLMGGSMKNIQPLMVNPRFHFNQGEVQHFPALSSILAKVERVYHLAALLGMFRVLAHPVLTLDDNIQSTAAILQAIRPLKQKPLLLIASSSEVYGNQKSRLIEDMPLITETTSKNHATYPISKISNESMALAYYHEYQLPVVVVRIFNTIGKNQTGRYGMVVPRFIKQALAHEPLTVFSDGKQTRSFCDVRDNVGLLDRLMENPASVGEIVNVGSPQLISMLSLAKKIKTLTKSQSEIQFVPYEEVYQGGYIDIQQRKIDTQKLMRLTQYQYQYTLNDTLAHLIDYARHEA